MRDEAAVRLKLDAARVLRTQKRGDDGLLVAIYLEGVTDILEWLLGERPELPLRGHDINAAPGGLQ